MSNLHVAVDGHWVCDRCGARGDWGPGWHWYGSAWPTDRPQRVLCPDCSPLEVDKVITP